MHWQSPGLHLVVWIGELVSMRFVVLYMPLIRNLCTLSALKGLPVHLK
jgi:hypothetical protein